MTAFQLPGWYPDPENPQLVRFWDSKKWSASMSMDMAQLTELSKLNSKYGKLHKIAFRVGFLALLALMGLIVALLSFALVPLSLLGI